MALMRWPDLSSDKEQSDPGAGDGGSQDRGEQCGGREKRKTKNRVWAHVSLMGPWTRWYSQGHTKPGLSLVPATILQLYPSYNPHMLKQLPYHSSSSKLSIPSGPSSTLHFPPSF